MDTLALEGKIMLALKQIYDPEIPVNIYDLGLIYEIRVDDAAKAWITMTLTSPNCPVAETLPVEVKEAALDVEGIREVDLNLTFDPPWTKEMMTEEAMLDLGLL
jgi:FeS assembly SUF system protein